MKLTAPIFILKQHAKALARKEKIPLHQALDRIASREGLNTWSLLSRSVTERSSRKLLAQLVPGQLVLIASRPGQGKTMLSLELAIEAMRQGQSAAFFTLEFTPANVVDCFTSLGEPLARFVDRLLIDTSDQICADYIAARLATAAPKTLVVIDYLQLLDQRRENPSLSEQVQTLRAFARERQLIVVCLSQIDRSYDPEMSAWPSADDIRLPNPLDLKLFDQMCFMNRGRVQLGAAST